MKLAVLSFVLLLSAAGAFAQPAGFEKVLFPIVIHPMEQVPGALGSQWVTDISVLNLGDVPVPLAGQYWCFFCLTAQPLQREVTYGSVPVPARGDIGGSFLFVDSRYLDQLRFNLRVRDVSREAEGFGSEVPVVRERDFHANGVSLLGIPNRSNLRLMLRVYGLDAGGGDVIVRVYEQRTALIVHLFSTMPVDALVAERTYTLAQIGTDTLSGVQNFPAYAQIADLPMPSTPLARIDIVPLTPGLRIWAFASATNNTTQQVTVISPHS